MSDWFVEGARFSHQQKLTSKVAALLGGEATDEPQTVAKSVPQPEHPPAPAAVSETNFKKLEAPLTRIVSVAARPAARIAFVTQDDSVDGRGRAAPPHGPPRATTVS